MSDTSLRVVWVYPDLLSTYGDQGNALAGGAAGAAARAWTLEPAWTSAPTSRSPTSGDIYLIGGGEDRPQRLAAERLLL